MRTWCPCHSVTVLNDMKSVAHRSQLHHFFLSIFISPKKQQTGNTIRQYNKGGTRGGSGTSHMGGNGGHNSSWGPGAQYAAELRILLVYLGRPER